MEGGKAAKHLQSPPQLSSHPHTGGLRGPGMGRMRLWRWGTSAAASSMSPPPGQVGVQALGQTPAIHLQKKTVPCPLLPHLSSPGTEWRLETQHSVWGGGEEKAVWEQICRDSGDWVAARRAEALRTAHARPRAGPEPGRLSPGSGTEKHPAGRGLLPGEGVPGVPWGDGANCCLTSSWSPPSCPKGLVSVPSTSRGETEAGGSGAELAGAGGMHRTADGWGKGSVVGGPTHLPWGSNETPTEAPASSPKSHQPAVPTSSTRRATGRPEWGDPGWGHPSEATAPSAPRLPHAAAGPGHPTVPALSPRRCWGRGGTQGPHGRSHTAGGPCGCSVTHTCVPGVGGT